MATKAKTHYYSVSTRNTPRLVQWTVKEAAQASGLSEHIADDIANELARLQGKFGKSIWKASSSAVAGDYTYVTLDNVKYYIWRQLR